MHTKQQNKYQKEDQKIFRKYCQKYNYFPLIYPAKRRIVVMGDLHGDYDLTIKLFRLAQVIDENGSWIGGDTFIVQVGDQIDSYRPEPMEIEVGGETKINTNQPEDIKILKFMTDMDAKARDSGGAVISLIGNHELMNISGNFDYVSKKDINGFRKHLKRINPELEFETDYDARKYAFSPGNEYAKYIACTRLPAVIIGDYLFVHAGIVPDFTRKLGITVRDDLYKINVSLKKWLLGLINEDNVTAILRGSKYSMFWDRILGSIPPNVSNEHPICVKYLDETLKLLKIGKMIIGHTPQYYAHKSGINSTCDDKLWRVDFAGSFGFNKFDPNFLSKKEVTEFRQAQALEILDDHIRILKHPKYIALDLSKLDKNRPIPFEIANI